MNELELKGNQIFLDGKKLNLVEKFKLKSIASESHAELYVKLLVKLT